MYFICYCCCSYFGVDSTGPNTVCTYVYVCVGDDDKSDGSKPTQVLSARFACVNQVSSGSLAQSAVSLQIMPT